MDEFLNVCSNHEGFGPVSKYYDLTICFVDGVLFNASSAFMVLAGLYQLYSLSRHHSYQYRKDWLIWARLLLVGVQVVFTAFYPVRNVSWYLQLFALAVAGALHWVEYNKSRVSNGVLLFFWLFNALFGGLRVANMLIRNYYEDARYTDILTISVLLSVNSVLVLALEWLPSKPKLPYEQFTDMKKNPRDVADIFARLSFSWMTPLMRKGHEKFLTEEDLYKLPKNYGSKDMSNYFLKYWKSEVDHRASPSLARALVYTFGPMMLLGGVFKAIQDICAFVQPQLLRILIKFVNDYSDIPNTPLVSGFMISLAMFGVSIFQTMMLHQYFAYSWESGMNLKAGLTSIIYQKALLLSNEARATQATGDIVNLMAVDVQRLQDLSQWGQLIWSGPFQIVMCLYSLYKLLGHSMWVGVFLMIIAIPLNSYIIKYQKTLQKKQMKNKDERTRVTSEILNNIKSLKLYGWEIPFKNKLNNVRNNKELKNLKSMALTQAVANFQFNILPFLVSCCTFAVFVITEDRPLSTDLVFPALTLFNLLSFPLAVFPNAITAFVEASVSINRMWNFLTSEELQKDAVLRLPKVNTIGDVAVNVNNATFLWQRKPEYKVALSGLNFQAKKGQLHCVVGKVGSGKSALIQSLLGDLQRVDGSVSIYGSVAYVAQTPWIMNATVKENILFGHKYDEEFYEKTIKACALSVDFSILPQGDSTLVGEKGISLSGGQKARLSLARAVYARTDVYLMDDILAAVDEHVAKHLVNHVLGPAGLLHTKTKVLSTNKITVLSIADQVTLLEDGKATEQGTYEEITSKSDSHLSRLIKEYGKKSDDESTPTPEEVIDEAELKELEDDSLADVNDVTTLRRASVSTLRTIGFGDDEVDAQRKEHREQGKVKWDVYLEYARACNPKYVLVFISCIVVSMSLSVLGNVWLKHWSEVNTEKGYNPDIPKYLGTYFALGVGAASATMIQTTILWLLCSIKGSEYLHRVMLDSVLAAPMSFFETTPIGRILNRFSNDIYKVDEVLARTFSMFFTNVIKVSFTIIVICTTTWQFIFVVLPLSVLYMYYQQYYMRTSRELRRLDSVTKSPVYANFQETLGGVSTIRGYAQQERFNHINQARVDNNLSAFYPAINANRWLAVRLEFLGSVIIFGAATLGILRLKSGNLTAGMIGLSLSYALQVTQSLNWIVRMTVEVETNIVSVERIKEYAALTPEAPYIIEDSRPPANWPSKGEIVFKDYATRYRSDLDLILRNINLHINPQEKVGIVGRTGAGKSSLTLALFRIIEAAGGCIEIDGINTSTLGLADLRHKLSIIPQDSQVFEGTIRENIDPTQQYTDEQIWNALELSHLKEHIKTMGEGEATGLDAQLSEGGSNLSVGQRQLMCLARAILIPSKILVLDEATAAVDVETDKVIQETIRSAFKDRTILTIAHRINTIMDSDKIIVLDKGEVKEFDSPQELLKNPDSLFYALCKEAGLVQAA